MHAQIPHDTLPSADLPSAAAAALLRERLQTLEAELETRKVLPPGAVETRSGNAAESAARNTDLTAFTTRILSELGRDRTPVSSIDPRVKDLLQTHQQLNVK